MAGNTTKANLMQTAVNAASDITAAFVSAGLAGDRDEAKSIFESFRDDIFATLSEQPNDAPQRSSGGGGSKGSGGGGSRTREGILARAGGFARSGLVGQRPQSALAELAGSNRGNGEDGSRRRLGTLVMRSVRLPHAALFQKEEG